MELQSWKLERIRIEGIRGATNAEEVPEKVVYSSTDM